MDTTDPVLLTDDQIKEEMAGIDAITKPMYAELNEMHEDKAFHRGRYTPDAQAVRDRIEPHYTRWRWLECERDRRAHTLAVDAAWRAKDARIAAAPVYQRRNGWEIVKDTGGTFVQYAVRHPRTLEEVYMGKLQRCRQVADESKPEWSKRHETYRTRTTPS